MCVCEDVGVESGVESPLQIDSCRAELVGLFRDPVLSRHSLSAHTLTAGTRITTAHFLQSRHVPILPLKKILTRLLTDQSTPAQVRKEVGAGEEAHVCLLQGPASLRVTAVELVASAVKTLTSLADHCRPGSEGGGRTEVSVCCLSACLCASRSATATGRGPLFRPRVVAGAGGPAGGATAAGQAPPEPRRDKGGSLLLQRGRSAGQEAGSDCMVSLSLPCVARDSVPCAAGSTGTESFYCCCLRSTALRETMRLPRQLSPPPPPCPPSPPAPLPPRCTLPGQRPSPSWTSASLRGPSPSAEKP